MAATSLSQPIVVTQETPGVSFAGRSLFQPVPGRITIRRVLEATAAHFRVSVGDLTSHERQQPLARRRQVAYYAARRVTGRSLPFIARYIGGRDHSTILWGVRRVEARLDAGDVETSAAVDQIIGTVTGGANV
jgi:chromosomal replication initiation ATPase DnaA